MEIINVLQGSPEWHAVRAQHFTASEASAALGLSKYTTRNELLKQKASSVAPDEDADKAYLFAKGHAAEAAARPIVEGILGEDLFPCTGTLLVDGLPLLASFDGITIGEDIIWETKLLNADLLERVKSGDLEPHYWLQIEQQLLVSGAEKCYFTTTDGTPANTHGTWYTSVPERRAMLIAGWKQFAKDLAAYQHVEVLPAPVAKPVERLPALVVNLVGEVTRSNLSAYKAAAIQVISNINTELSTDQHFADAESHIKFCDAGERELEQVKNQALSQTATIEELFRTIDDLKEHLRAKRLTLEKLVKTRKETIRVEIVTQARAKYAEHVIQLNNWLGANYLPVVQPDFAAAIKGKRTVSSLHEACDTLLAKSKIEIDATASHIKANLKHLEGFPDQQFLFNDLSMLVFKNQEDFAITVRDRITQHAAAEAAKQEAQREAIRQEELARIAREQAAKAKAEREEADRLERVAAIQRESELAVQQACAVVEVIDADGVITQAATGAEIEARIAQSPMNAPSPLRSFATASPRPRAATRAMVDVFLDTLSEPDLHHVLTFLQDNFAKRAA